MAMFVLKMDKNDIVCTHLHANSLFNTQQMLRLKFQQFQQISCGSIGIIMVRFASFDEVSKSTRSRTTPPGDQASCYGSTHLSHKSKISRERALITMTTISFL